jgi:cation diffusion facilitator CzcD-associated flavoprotein CzcO
MGPYQENKLDVLIVGAGFSGCFALKELTNLGLKCKAFEVAPEAGGVWYVLP